MAMLDLTVIILTKNEENNLPKCIASFGDIVKRFVIVDSGSTDGTKAFCEEADRRAASYGGQVSFFEHEWDSYAQQFNWGIENTSIDTEWIMRMDADEEITLELKCELSERLSSVSNGVNGIIIKRRVYFMGRWLKHGGKYPEYLLRIIRRGTGKCEERRMDEHLIINSGSTINFSYDLIDNNTKDLTWWTEKHNWYSGREAEDYRVTFEEAGASTNIAKQDSNGETTSPQALRKRFIKNHGYYKLPKFFRAHIYFIYRYYIRLGFLDGTEGKIYTFLQAYWYRFLVDAKIYEREKIEGYEKDSCSDL